jgi:hypothetical protein
VMMIRSCTFSLLLALFGETASADPVLSSSVIKKSIASLGARETLSQIYDKQDQWSGLLTAIATGKRDWLEIAKQLRSASDGGATEQLGLAVGEALEQRPANVLSLAVTEFGIEYVCGGPDVDDPRFDSYELSMAAIDRRERMLRSFRDHALDQIRDSCVAELEKARATVARFYGRAK